MAKMVSIDHSVRLDPQQKIVRAADYQTYLEFADLQQHAVALRDAANHEAEQIRRKAYDKGLAQGLVAAEQQIVQQRLQLTAEKAAFVADVEGQLPTLVMSLVRSVLADFSDSDKLAAMTQQVLAKIKTAQRIIICLHPSQQEAFTQALSERIEQTALADCIEIQADNDIPAHQCHVEFEEGLYILDWQQVVGQMAAQMAG